MIAHLFNFLRFITMLTFFVLIFQVQTGNVSISKPETQQLNLETRLFQLEHAIQMELWQVNIYCIRNFYHTINYII